VEQVKEGFYLANSADSIRTEGNRVIEGIQRRELPFGDVWTEW
jgi:hypothetical protein